MKLLESLIEDDKLEEIGPPYVCRQVDSWVFIFSTPSLTPWALGDNVETVYRRLAFWSSLSWDAL